MKRRILCALIGMIIMLGIFLIRFIMDDTFKSADDIEREFGVIPLTVIPEGKISGQESKESTRTFRRKRRRKEER